MAKKKKEKEEAQVKPLQFTSAKLRDGFCDYTMAVKLGEGVGTHSVKGIGLYEFSLTKAFKRLNVHLAIVDDFFKHSGLEIANTNEAENTPFADLYDVSAFSLKGEDDNLSVVIKGTKYVTQTGGERLEITSHKIPLGKSSLYKWKNELLEAITDCQNEVEQYYNGHYTLPENEFVDKNQLSIVDEAETVEQENA